jgi:branched-chain amino acid transport system ATP-binding protein
VTRNILEVRGLQKHFGGNHVTQDISLDIAEGSKEAIIGPNGAGKTTFFNLLTGYHRPDSGTVTFDGRDITGWPPHRIARAGISRAFQISNIFVRMTARENARSAVHAQMGESLNIYSRAALVGAERTQQILELCGLAARSEAVAGELSQGDKKKLELALALATKPKLVFLDEPTAGMSLEETRGTMALVDRLNSDLGLTILFTEHDMSVVFNHANRVTLLHRGEIIIQGKPAEVRSNTTAQKIYLGEHHL